MKVYQMSICRIIHKWKCIGHNKDYVWLMDFIEEMTKKSFKSFLEPSDKMEGACYRLERKWPRVEFMKLLSERWKVDV